MPNPRLARRLTLYNWIDLPEEKTAVKRESLQGLETRLAEFIFTAEAGIRHAVEEASELGTLPGYKEVENETGDVVYAEKEMQFYAWNATTKEWVPIPAPHWRTPVSEASELPTEGNELGDVRVDEETFQLYIWQGAGPKWKIFKPTESEKHVHTIETLTWSIAEKVTTSPEVIPGGFRRLASASSETATLYELEFTLRKGTAEFELKVGGTAIKNEAGETKIKVKTGAPEVFKVKSPFVKLEPKDVIELLVKKEGEEPEGLSLSAFVEHIAKVV
jgi:hypothetical protein